MKTIEQLETKIEDLEQSLSVALEELNAWKNGLQLIGDSPQAVWESWRSRQIKMFKYQREAIVWRDKAKNKN